MPSGFSRSREPIAGAKIAFAAGLGPLGFGMFRMLRGVAYDDNRVWFLFWEEATELLLMAGTCCLPWIFRRGLIPDADARFRAVIGLLGVERESPATDAIAPEMRRRASRTGAAKKLA